jgi:uncharacterized protein (DUF2062 family)
MEMGNSMRKRSLPNKVKRLAKVVYLKLFRINDSPLKIALGFGLGVFIGVMPGVGPVIALLLAFLFRVNRASALLGSILFNTWVGLIALLLAIKIGSYPDRHWLFNHCLHLCCCRIGNCLHDHKADKIEKDKS